MLLASDVKLRRDDEECNTLHPIMIEIKDKAHLNKFKKRYYKLPGELQGDYRIITGKETDLIGKVIMVRTPVTCASTEGICRKCYGDLFYTNRDLESVGGLAATKNAEPLSQKILSAKHLLTTDSEKIEFTGIFNKFFFINSSEVMLDPETDADLENYSLVLIKENIYEFEEMDESGINSLVTIFHILDKRTEEVHEITEVKGKKLFISPMLRDIIEESSKKKSRGRGKAKKVDNHDVYEIPLVDIGFEDSIFLIEISNNALTKPLYEIMDLLDSRDKRTKAGITTIDSMVQRLVELYIKAGMPIDAVHGEILIRAIIRSKKDILEMPDFTRYDAIRDVDILTVKSALNNNPSITVSLSYQALGRQLTNPLTFRKKAGSFMDPYFREQM